MIVRRFFNTLKQSCYTNFKWAVNRLKIRRLFKFNESMLEITYKSTGQKILFRVLDNPLKITSITVDVGRGLRKHTKLKTSISSKRLLSLFVVPMIHKTSLNRLL
ncbi:phage terminase large subunit [Bacillus sp. JAS24-2]|uniref:phage terminase large subunit n=1 Tax=Bacillus sp. JAS24-2 TaxID=2217832 RepID=UPI0021020AB4|nr:phage terminase large subunit [Bacillus sp. JAS24-2]